MREQTLTHHRSALHPANVRPVAPVLAQFLSVFTFITLPSAASLPVAVIPVVPVLPVEGEGGEHPPDAVVEQWQTLVLCSVHKFSQQI